MFACVQIIGVILAAVASVISNLGLNLQKLCHLRNLGKSETIRRNYAKQRLWLFGLSLIIFGSFADFTALGFGAQSIIAPLGSLTLVSNVFFAPCLLKEVVRCRDYCATFTIIVGSSLSVAFASKKDTIYGYVVGFAMLCCGMFVVCCFGVCILLICFVFLNFYRCTGRLKQLFGFYERISFFVYAMTVIIVMLILRWYINYMERIQKEGENSKKYLDNVKYFRFSYAAVSGIVGAQSVLFAKCFSELLINSFAGGGFFLAYYQTYLVVICMGACIYLQIKWLNDGLRRFDAVYIVPVFQSFWILVSVVAGLVFFHEYKEMSAVQIIVFPLGILLTILGVYFLSQRGTSPGRSADQPLDINEESSPNGSDTPLLPGATSTPRHKSMKIDSDIGFMGKMPPAVFSGSSMGRCSDIYVKQTAVSTVEISKQPAPAPVTTGPGHQNDQDDSFTL